MLSPSLIREEQIMIVIQGVIWLWASGMSRVIPINMSSLVLTEEWLITICKSKGHHLASMFYTSSIYGM